MLEGTRNEIHNNYFSLIPLSEVDDFFKWEIICFNCGNKDLNEFFQIDAYSHYEELLATTYLFQPKEATENDMFFPVALISLLNDKIDITREDRKSDKKSFYKKVKKEVPYPKQLYNSFPAVKIGRLGVHKKYHSEGIGTALLNMMKNRSSTLYRYRSRKRRSTLSISP